MSKYERIETLFDRAASVGRMRLLEHECYELLELTGAEAAPVHRLIPAGEVPTAADLEAIPGEKVVLKIVSPEITHKTEARGIRIVAREMGAVEAAHELMLHQVPQTYAAYLGEHRGELGPALSGLDGEQLRKKLEEEIVGVLLCSFIQADAQGFATELFVGIRHTEEFGPIISAGFGGVEMETLTRETRKGAAVAIAPTGLVDGEAFLELFRRTLSYQRLSGTMRGSRKLVSDEILVECFQAFIDLANHFSENNPDTRYRILEFEVNPFQAVGSRLAPLDGVCSFEVASAPRAERPLEKISALLRPKSVAVIGVSARSMNMGRIILNNIVKVGFDPAKTWIIRPETDEIDGITCVPSIGELPEKVDLLVVAVGADQVPGVIDTVIDEDKAESVILIPGGLGEKKGSEDLARQLKEKIEASHRSPGGGPVFVGGNSLGVISHPGHYDTMFIPESKLPKSRGEHQRKSCFISQSGAFIIANLSRMPWFDPAWALSIGNQMDLTASDLLSYISRHEDIDVFAVYMEGFQRSDGLAFARAVREAVDLGKEVVFYKAGRTPAGRSATAGHTASVAGDYAVCEAALEEAGAWVAKDFNEFSDLLKLATRLHSKGVSGRRVAALSNAGFEAVGMADSIRVDREALDLRSFEENTRTKLEEILVKYRLDGLVDAKNPFDITPMANDQAYASLVSAILEADEIDAVLVGIVPLTPAIQSLPPSDAWRESIESEESICRLLPDVAAASDKPVIVVIDSGEIFEPMAKLIESRGLPVFRSGDRAMRSLCRYINSRLSHRPAERS